MSVPCYSALRNHADEAGVISPANEENGVVTVSNSARKLGEWDMYSSVFDRDPITLIGAPATAVLGPYIWGAVTRTDGAAPIRLGRTMLYLEGSHDGINWDTFHAQMVDGGSRRTQSDPGGWASQGSWGPIFCPYRTVIAHLINVDAVAQTWNTSVFTGHPQHLQGGRSYSGDLGFHAVQQFMDRANLGVGVTKRGPIILTDPGYRLEADRPTISALAADVSLVCVDGNELAFAADITGNGAGDALEVKILGGDAPADPLPDTLATYNLIVGANTVLDSESLTVLGGVGAAVAFPPKVKTPFVQMQYRNAGVSELNPCRMSARVQRA